MAVNEFKLVATRYEVKFNFINLDSTKLQFVHLFVFEFEYLYKELLFLQTINLRKFNEKLSNFLCKLVEI